MTGGRAVRPWARLAMDQMRVVGRAHMFAFNADFAGVRTPIQGGWDAVAMLPAYNAEGAGWIYMVLNLHAGSTYFLDCAVSDLPANATYTIGSPFGTHVFSGTEVVNGHLVMTLVPTVATSQADIWIISDRPWTFYECNISIDAVSAGPAPSPN